MYLSNLYGAVSIGTLILSMVAPMACGGPIDSEAMLPSVHRNALMAATASTASSAVCADIPAEIEKLRAEIRKLEKDLEEEEPLLVAGYKRLQFLGSEIKRLEALLSRDPTNQEWLTELADTRRIMDDLLLATLNLALLVETHRKEVQALNEQIKVLQKKLENACAFIDEPAPVLPTQPMNGGLMPMPL